MNTRPTIELAEIVTSHTDGSVTETQLSTDRAALAEVLRALRSASTSHSARTLRSVHGNWRAYRFSRTGLATHRVNVFPVR